MKKIVLGSLIVVLAVLLVSGLRTGIGYLTVEDAELVEAYCTDHYGEDWMVFMREDQNDGMVRFELGTNINDEYTTIQEIAIRRDILKNYYVKLLY